MGDSIRGATVEGKVVGFTLHATQLRTVDGHLITIPNSALQVVELDDGLEQIDIRVNIGYATDVRKAIEMLQKIALEVEAAIDVQGERNARYRIAGGYRAAAHAAANDADGG